MKLFEEIRGTEIFLAEIASEIDGLIRDNPMTPQVALDKINQIVTRRDAYLTRLRTLQNELRELGIEPSRMEPGQAELGILLPRELFQNHLVDQV